jgi:hypothetical protein
MTLTIDVPADVEGALQEKAQQTGLSVAEFATAILAQVGSISRASSAEQVAEIAARLTALQRIGSYDTRARAGLAPLSDEDICRESIY